MKIGGVTIFVKAAVGTEMVISLLLVQITDVVKDKSSMAKSLPVATTIRSNSSILALVAVPEFHVNVNCVQLLQVFRAGANLKPTETPFIKVSILAGTPVDNVCTQ